MEMVPIASWLAEAEAHRRKYGRPLVTLSYAQSLDGSISTRRGEPLAISGPASLALTHRLRAAHQALLVGIGTVLADNPRLNVRLAEGESPRPVILDSHLRCPLEARLFQSGRQAPILAAAPPVSPAQRSRLQAAGAEIWEIPRDSSGRLSLAALLTTLGQAGISSLMVEGGARVITSFLQAHLVDQVILTVAPLFIGGLNAVEETLLPTPLRLEDVGITRMDEDIILWGKICAEEG